MASPPYSPAISTLSLLSLPSYSASPHPSEETLIFSPRSLAQTLPTGTFCKQSKHATVVLYNQEDGASKPVYGSRSSISGEIAIERKENVTGVDIKVRRCSSALTNMAAHVKPYSFRPLYQP